MAIALIIGLGNPGPTYANTRHNAGAWFVDALAHRYQQHLKPDAKHKGLTARISVEGHPVRLFVPSAYMNVCGLPIRALVHFYKVPLSSLLIVHDELDFPPGVAKFKRGGGHAGHNGLRDIIRHLSSPLFCRLRLGIGHPGHRDKVSDYVLSPPSLDDKTRIDRAIDETLDEIASLVVPNDN